MNEIKAMHSVLRPECILILQMQTRVNHDAYHES